MNLYPERVINIAIVEESQLRGLSSPSATNTVNSGSGPNECPEISDRVLNMEFNAPQWSHRPRCEQFHVGTIFFLLNPQTVSQTNKTMLCHFFPVETCKDSQ